MIDNRSIFTLLRRGLRRRGSGWVVSINYSPLTTDVRVAAAWLAEEACTERRRRRESTQDIGQVVYVRCIDLSNLV
jgi:hypothetical protein